MEQVAFTSVFSLWTLLPRSRAPEHLKSGFNDDLCTKREHLIAPWCICAAIPVTFILVVGRDHVCQMRGFSIQTTIVFMIACVDYYFLFGGTLPEYILSFGRHFLSASVTTEL